MTKFTQPEKFDGKVGTTEGH